VDLLGAPDAAELPEEDEERGALAEEIAEVEAPPVARDQLRLAERLRYLSACPCHRSLEAGDRKGAGDARDTRPA
jgi:hypothetical protein